MAFHLTPKRSAKEALTHSHRASFGNQKIGTDYQRVRETRKEGKPENGSALLHWCFYSYLFTWNFVIPSLKYAFICLAAAMPALVLASAVCAPIFFGVEK